MAMTPVAASKTIAQKLIMLLEVALLIYAAMLPFLAVGRVNAAQLTSRSVSMTTAIPNTAASYTFTFTLPSTAVVQGIQIQFCDNPVLAACNGTNNPTLGSVTTTGQSGWSQTPAWGNPTVQTNAGGGSASSNELQLTRTGGTSGSAESAVAKTLTFNNITNNNSGANKTFYARIRLYNSNSTFNSGTLVHDGNVANSTSQTLTVNARVQEVLNFCLGSTTVNDATTAVPSTCAGTSVDLGALDSGGVSITPVPVSPYGGDGNNAVALVQTNAQSGVTISYYTIASGGNGQLKVGTTSCVSLTDTADACINNGASNAQATITEAVEKYGMTVAAVNCGLTTAYTCVFSSGNYNLTRNANYDGNGTNTINNENSYNSAGTFVTNNGYAWNESTTATTVASSTTVVDREALILKFAATAGTTTPTGAYSTQASFIALPIF